MLIKCPECGKDVSNKANACIHCGYPLQTIKKEESSSELPDIERQILNIDSKFNSFVDNPDMYKKDLNNLFFLIKDQVDIIIIKILTDF